MCLISEALGGKIEDAIPRAVAIEGIQVALPGTRRSGSNAGVILPNTPDQDWKEPVSSRSQSRNHRQLNIPFGYR